MDDAQSYSGVDNLKAMEAARRYRAFLLHTITSAVGPPSETRRLLDLGSGTGTYAIPLRDLGYEVTCVEPDTELLDGLKAAGFNATADVDTTVPASIDGVYGMNVLEHIDDEVATLRALHTVTRPGGRLVLYVPALSMLFSSMDRKVGHQRRYRRRSFEQLVAGAGFTVDRCRYVDSLGIVASLLYKVFGNRRGDISPRSVGAYDRFAFPVSRLLDRLTTGRLGGKNLLLIGTR